MTDLETEAAELTARFAASRIPVFCTAGKNAVKFWKAAYLGATTGYGTSRKIAMAYLR